MHKLLIAFLSFALVSWTVSAQEKNCLEIRSCIQKDLGDLTLKANNGTQKEFLQKLADLQKNFEATYLSKASGYADQPNLAYATSLMELITAPGTDFVKLKKSLNSRNCLQIITRMRESTRSFFKDALSQKPKYHYDTEAWKSYEALLDKICELK